jgi:sugar phosphate isomerase/epimerase
MSATNLLSFSTLGCPQWNLDQILAATQWGYTGVELRGYLDQMDLPRATPFTLQNRAQTRRRFEDAGLRVVCVSSSGRVADNNLDHVKAHAELARDLNCERVRVFGGNLPDGVPRSEAIARAAQVLRGFGDVAKETGVTIVLETHDAFSTGATVAELLHATQHPAVFSLWDLHHPYRQGEALEETYQLLAPTVRYTHVKDSKPGGEYCLLGEGDIPVFPMLQLLLDGGYTGPISLEWEKRWKPDIAPPEVAFPQYAQGLRAYLDGTDLEF